MFLIPFYLALVAAYQTPQQAIDVRLGVVAYQDLDRGIADLERLFDELNQSAGSPVRVRVALGTYGDVIYWLQKGLIDVALLTPGAFVEAMKVQEGAKPACQYLASRLLPQAGDGKSKTASAGYRDHYRAVCVVAERSPLRTIADVRRAWQAGRVRFTFVDPLSASGHIAPAFALEQAGIRPAPDEVEYSYSHTNSLRLIGPNEDGYERVAFIWDGALDQAVALPPSRRIALPQLDQLEVPVDVVVARAGFEHADRVLDLLLGHTGIEGVHDFARFDDWRERYGELGSWINDLHLALDSDEIQAVSLDGLGQMLRLYAQTRPGGRPPRLALVLSGGGAKCSYQVGAATAVEEKLAELRQETGNDELAISLVAGTSGGAINALAMALGSSQTAAGQAELRRAWRSLDQRELVRPSRLVRGNMGLWFVCVELAAVLFVARMLVKAPRRRAWSIIAALLLIGLVQIGAAYLPYVPWTRLGQSHLLHHAWLWATFGVEWSGWCLLAVGLIASLWQWKLTRAGKTLLLPRWFTIWVLTIALVGLPLAQMVTILAYEPTLSDGRGIEQRLLESFYELAQFRAKELGLQPLAVDPRATTTERLSLVSRQILTQRLLARDLVVTGSCLERSSEDLPSDLYFYAPASSDSRSADYGERGVSLADRPEMLLDVVMGSGSIFPVFPPRTLIDFPRPGESVELVDGGFAHNSPIEAAVRWGATHIILIEADPQQRSERRNFVQNAAGAFNHLYYQAQLVDARSREKEQVVIFSLRPEPPHCCVLDFADNLIDAGIEKGYREARGESVTGAAVISGRRRFRKELGLPFFYEWTEKR